MMDQILLCFIIECCIVYVYDYVAFPRNLIAYIMGKIYKKEISLDRVKLPKLLECSLCATTWVTLIILLIFNWRLSPLCLVYGWSTQYVLRLYNITDNVIDSIFGWFEQKY